MTHDHKPRIPRPRNSWIIFRSEWYCEHKDELKRNGATISEISQAASTVWANMPREEELYWERRAAQAAIEHAQIYPGYKYKPRTTAEKAKKKKGSGQQKGKDKIQVKTRRSDASEECHPKKKRRVGEILIDSVLETSNMLGEDAAAVLSLTRQGEPMISVGPSSTVMNSSARAIPNLRALETGDYQFPFEFTIPYPPTEGCCNYSNITTAGASNTFSLYGEDEPSQNIKYPQDTYAVVDDVPDTFYIDCV